MKKLIALLLAAVMLLSLTACGGSAEPAQTAAPTVAATEAPTEPVETEPGIYYPADSEIDVALQDAQAPCISWADNQIYELALTGLGFKEVTFGSVIRDESNFYDMEGNKVLSPVYAATIHNIQFVDDKVRVEFAWYDFGNNLNDDGWVLYCTKADEIADISGLSLEYYDGRHEEIWADTSDIWKQRESFVQGAIYDYYKGIEAWGTVLAYYYPESGNLYNLVRTYDYFPDFGCSPLIMATNVETDGENMIDAVNLEFVDGYPIVTSEFTIICDDQTTTYKYRVGMSLAAWAASELNTDGWVLGPDNRLFSPDRQYWLECTDYRLEENSGRNFLTAIRSTAEHRNALAKSLEANTAAAYLVDWRSALLPTNFAVVGNHTEEVSYGMYDMTYGLDGAETLNLYMRNVHPSVLEDVKVYAVKDNPEMQIPEDALVLSFVEAEVSEQDARFGQTMAVATCDMAAGANAFAITYQGKLVYWIKLGQ